MNLLLACISLLSLSIWFTFKQNRLLARIAIPMFYMGTAGLIGVLLYNAWFEGADMWGNFMTYFLKFSVITLLTLFISNFKKFKLLNFVLFPLGLLWISPQLNFQLQKYADQEGELLVHLDDQVEYQKLMEAFDGSLFNITKAFEIDISEHPLNKYYLVDIEYKQLDKVTKKLKSLKFIDDFEYNETVQVEPIPTIESTRYSLEKPFWIGDPLFEQQWGLQALNPQELNDLLQEKQINPKSKIKIAILDTGVDGKHEDLEAVFTSTNSIYDIDQIGHGTHCAGIAAAMNHNGKGIASLPLNDFIEVTSIKVLKRGGSGTQKDIIQGIIDATDGGAKVLSLSLGGRSSDKKQRAYELAVNYANNQGAIVIVAAGNNGGDARNTAPANVPGVIAVAAVDENLNRASFSNSVEFIEMGIAAPGVNIISTVPGNQYKSFNGTSMATPFVASLVAIIKCIQPSSSTLEVFQILDQNSVQTQNNNQTGSLINPVKSIESIIGQNAF